MAGSYPVLPLDPLLCYSNHTSVRHSSERGFTVRAKLSRIIAARGNLAVFCKIVDLFHSHGAVDVLDMEARNFAALQTLQGLVIPRVYGYYDVLGLLELLALEDFGTAIPEDVPIDVQTRMKNTLIRIHSVGYIRRDIARRNFCIFDMVFLVDLQTLAVGSIA